MSQTLHGELGGLPPILIAVGGNEVLLDDSRRFAAEVEAAGGQAQLDVYEGLTHAFHATALLADPPPVAVTLLSRLAEWLTP